MKTRTDNFLFADGLPVESVGEGITRQMLGFDGQLMMVKVLFKKGATGTVHQHFHSQATYVMSGSFEVQIKGEKAVLNPGDGFYVEPDAPHGAVCLEDGVLIDVFSPQREEFLKKV